MCIRVLILSRRPAISRLLLWAKSPVTFYSKAKKCWAISWTFINETQMQVCRDIFVLRTLISVQIITQVLNFITFPIPGSQNPCMVLMMNMESLACRRSTWRSMSGFLFYYFFCLYKILKTSHRMFIKVLIRKITKPTITSGPLHVAQTEQDNIGRRRPTLSRFFFYFSSWHKIYMHALNVIF